MNLPQQLTFTQTADVLTMSWTQDGRKITETMNLAGAEQTTSSGNVMKVTWEANRIVVVIRANLGGNVVEQRRVFSMEGGNLVIELARPDVQGGTPTVARFVYKRGAARQLGIPVVASAHTDYEVYAGRYGVPWAVRAGWHYLRWFYGQAHRVLCPSRIYEQHLHARGVHHTGVWSRGVDPDCFHPRFRSQAYRAQLGVAPGDLLVTYIGRLAREKNLELLLRAWERLAPLRGSAQLALVGRGPLEEPIRRRELPGVHVPGLLQGEALSAAYSSADIFTFPSPTETFGNSLLEAMASGLPSLVAAAGGVLEFAAHGRNAWLVAPNSVRAIEDGLARLMQDEPLRRRLGEGALRTARERSWDDVYDRLIGDYEEAVAAARVRRAA
jgi:glycosyltransferase involved in cell wall biosynthesis